MDIHPESARMFHVDEEVEKAKKAAFRLLGRRAYTRLEIERKLRKRDFDGPVIDEVVAILQRLGLVDDEDFARRWVDERMRLRPAGRPVLVQGLRRRGVGKDVVDRVLDETLADVDLEAVALRLLRARERHYRRLDRDKALSRMYGFLARRGFNSAVARGAAERALAEFGEFQEDDSIT